MYCVCGCGNITPIATRNRPTYNKGDHIKYCPGHAGKPFLPKEQNIGWKGGRIKHSRGYMRVWVGLDHPMAHQDGYSYEHRMIMANHLGRFLKRTEIVHHENGNPSDNRLGNLRLCRNQSDHMRGHPMPKRKKVA